MQLTVIPRLRVVSRFAITLALIVGLNHYPATWANPASYPLWQSGGVIVLPEQRYNPAVQRMLAERALKVLPIHNGELFYIVPVGIDPRHEQAQIQYLEYLLTKRASQENAPAQ